MFRDVTKNHWAYNDIMLAKSLRLMQGDPDGNFRPNDPISRAEAAAVAVRTVIRSVQIAAGLVGIGMIGTYFAVRK